MKIWKIADAATQKLIRLKSTQKYTGKVLDVLLCIDIPSRHVVCKIDISVNRKIEKKFEMFMSQYEKEWVFLDFHD